MSARKNDPVALTLIAIGALGGLASTIVIARVQARPAHVTEVTPVAPAAPAPPVAPVTPAPPTLVSARVGDPFEDVLQDVSSRVERLVTLEGQILRRLQENPVGASRPRAARTAQTRWIVGQKVVMLDELAALGQRIDRVTEMSADRPGTRGPVVAVRDVFRNVRLRERIAWSRGLILGDDRPMAREFEALIARDLDRLRGAVAEARVALEGVPLPHDAEEDLSARPVFTPFTVAPRMLNAAKVGAVLDAIYPAELRDAGIGGSVNVWFFLDEQGEVVERRIIESSGHAALDMAALELASVARFTPALNRDQAVPVWVEIPVTFQPR